MLDTYAGIRIALLALLTATSTAARGSEAPLAQLDALERAVHALELQQVDADALQIYVGSDDEELLLRRASVRIDDRPPYEYEYSDAESQALRAHGLHRLPVRMPGAGTPRVRVQLVARRADARWDAPRIVVTLDQTITSAQDSTSVQFSLFTAGLRRSAAVRMTLDAAADTQQPRADAYDAATRAAPAGTPAFAGAAGDALARYNDALSRLQQGDPAQGEALLDALGMAEADDVQGLTLRDLANVTLGYARLRARRGAEAIEAFKRVRSPGPYGNTALLGLGWAHLLPHDVAPTDAGTPWPPAEADSPELRRRMPFRYASAVAGGARAEDVEAALVPWNELNGRDPLDPAVQEGMLAVAYALHHVGAHAQAQRHYERAVGRLHEAAAQLDDALAQLHDGRLLAALDTQVPDGWRRWLADLPYDDVTAYVRWLCESAAFLQAYEARRTWRDAAVGTTALLHRLDRLPAGDAQALRAQVAALDASIDAAVDDADEALTAVAARVLQARRTDTLAYLAEARFALARLNDPAPVVAAAGTR